MSWTWHDYYANVVAYEYDDSDGDVQPYEYTDACANKHGDANKHADPANWHANAQPNTDTHVVADDHLDPDGHANAQSNTDGNGDAERHVNRHADRNAHHRSRARYGWRWRTRRRRQLPICLERGSTQL